MHHSINKIYRATLLGHFLVDTDQSCMSFRISGNKLRYLCYIVLSMSVFKMYVDIFCHMDHVSEINNLSYLILLSVL